jgi:PAS domain S-box-containing protein
MDIQNIIIYTILLVFIYLGLTAISYNPQSNLNRIFFIICITMVIRCAAEFFSYYQETLFLYDISGFIAGVSLLLLPAMLVHFFLILARKKIIVNNRLFMASLYAPSLVLSFYSMLNGKFFESYMINYFEGSLNSNQSLIAYVFIALFSLYYTSSLVLVINNRIKSISRQERLQALIIFLSLVAPFPVSIIFFFYTGLGEIFPAYPFAPIYSLLWASGILFSIKKFSLLIPTPEMAADVIIDKMKALFFILNPSMAIIRNNKQAENLLGYDEDYFKGKPLTAFIYEKDLMLPVPRQREDVSVREHTLKVNFISKNGERIPFNLVLTGLNNSLDELIGYAAVADDISDKITLQNEMKERILIQQAYNESEERYKKITEAMLDYVIMVNEKSEYIYASPSHVRLGYTPKELIGKSAFNLIHPEDLSRVMKAFSEGLQSKTIKTAEFRFKKSDGTYIDLESVGSFIYNEDNTLQNILVCSRDITERKKILAALEESEKLYRQLVDFASDFIWRADTYGRMIYANPNALRVMCMEEEDVLGTDYLNLVPSEYRSEIRRFYINQYRHRIPNTYYEFPVVNSKFETVWLGINMQMIIDDEGNVVWQGIGRDISERRKFMQALKESEELLRIRNLSFERDLQNAQLVQKALLPGAVPEFKSLNIEYRNFSMDAVGGDYFSFTKLREGGLGVFLGDVSGHGVTAALFLALVKSTADRACRKHGQNPGEYISRLNNDLINAMHSYFLTAIYGYFYLDEVKKTVTFTFAKGGHPAPVLYKKSTDEYKLIKSKGTLIGKFSDIEFEEVQIPLQKGDRLFLYTDGFPETRNSSGEIIGYDELCSLIKNESTSSLSDTIDSIINKINIYKGNEPYDDDLVIIGFEVT